LVERERNSWNEEKYRIRKTNPDEDEILHLNVGGVTNGFSVSKELLCSIPDSLLARSFSGAHPI